MIRPLIATAVSCSVAFFALAQTDNDWEDRKFEGSTVFENGDVVPTIFFSSSAKKAFGNWSLTFEFTQDAETGELGELGLELTFNDQNHGWGICSLGKTGVLEAKRGYSLNPYRYERETVVDVVENRLYDNVFSIEKPLDFLRWLNFGKSASTIKMRLTDGCSQKYEMEFHVDGEPFETVEEFKQFR